MELRPVCYALVSTAARAGARGGDLLAPRLAELIEATPEAAAEPADYARRACDAYDALRVSWAPSKRPGWDEYALRRHWDRLGRILAGVDPWPVPWEPPSAPAATGTNGRPRVVGMAPKGTNYEPGEE